MRISDGETREQGDGIEVSARIDGFRLWFRVPGSGKVSGMGDPFVAAALLPAMLQGEGLEVDRELAVSPRLLEHLGRLQEIHHCWNPIFKIVPVRAAGTPAPGLNRGVLTFFSGGVDSTYTFLKRREELTHLVFIQGFDFYASPALTGSFAADEIADLSQLAFRLSGRRRGVDGFLASRLTKRTGDELAALGRRGRIPDGLEVRLAGELEDVLRGPAIWDDRRFAGAALRPATRELLKDAAQGGTSYLLNRRLVEDAYPLEIARRDDSVYRRAIERNARFAGEAGKTLITVSTNHFAFGYRYNLSRNLTQGSALASVALLLGFPKVYLPAAYSYNQLIPLGSHPLTDPLWSNESVEIVHDGGEARRVDKVVRVAGDEAALANLRVCFTDMNRNCGRCSKCLRTMIPLARLGVPGAPFPPLPPLRELRRLRVANDIEKIFFEENLDPALRSREVRLDRALRASMRRYERQRWLKDLDRVVLRGSLKRLLRRGAAAEAAPLRIDTTPPR